MAILALLGCRGSGVAGSYVAELEVVREPGHGTAEFQAIESVRSRLKAEPDTLEVRNGSFSMTTGGATVSEGTWRTDGNKIYLTATSYKGTPIQKSLQLEKSLEILSDGSLKGTPTAEGYVIVYKRRT